MDSRYLLLILNAILNAVQDELVPQLLMRCIIEKQPPLSYLLCMYTLHFRMRALSSTYAASYLSIYLFLHRILCKDIYFGIRDVVVVGATTLLTGSHDRKTSVRFNR